MQPPLCDVNLRRPTVDKGTISVCDMIVVTYDPDQGGPTNQDIADVKALLEKRMAAAKASA